MLKLLIIEHKLRLISLSGYHTIFVFLSLAFTTWHLCVRIDASFFVEIFMAYFRSFVMVFVEAFVCTM